MSRFTNFIAGAILGGLAGAAVILLFAPMSGDQLRSALQDRAQRMAEDVRQAGSQKRAELELELERLRKSNQ